EDRPEQRVVEFLLAGVLRGARAGRRGRGHRIPSGSGGGRGRAERTTPGYEPGVVRERVRRSARRGVTVTVAVSVEQRERDDRPQRAAVGVAVRSGFARVRTAPVVNDPRL